jgi:glycosyltransferase involved in cell wall biosynthesis
MLRLARLLGVPSAIHYHMGRLPAIIGRAGLEWKLTRQAMSLADAVILLDQESERAVRPVLPHPRITTLPNMVETDRVEEISRRKNGVAPHPVEGLKIVYAGHVIPTKGIRELVEACTRLTGQVFELHLAGPLDDAFREQLLALARSRAPAPWLHIHGAMSQEAAIEQIASADLFVLPSYTEGAPNVILEAMACGRTILSTTVGAIPEMLDLDGPQPCGLCVPPRDTQALLGAMARLLGDPALRRQLAERAQQRVKQMYAAPLACAKLADLWRAVARPVEDCQQH